MSSNVIQPKAVASDSPVFEEPWQAQLLAMADLLIESGKITPTQWSEALGEQLNLKQAEQDTLDNYYQAVLATLNQLIQSNDLISLEQLQARENDWEKAYLTTPHGQPVELKE